MQVVSTQDSQAGWTLMFAEGEKEARRSAGEWTGETLGEMARRNAERHPETLASVGETGGITYARLLEDGSALARALAELGLKPGETISFQLPNWVEAQVLDLACALGGYVINPIIPIYRQHELRFILNDCQARAVFVPESFRGVDYPRMMASLREEVPSLEHVVVVRGAPPETLAFDDLLATGRGSSMPFAEADADSAKFIMYTSGTTGQPKGVLYTQNQMRRPLWASMQAWKLGRGARLLMPSPVTHITGFGYGLEMPSLFGTFTYFMEKWDAERAIDLIDEHRLEFTVGATPFLSELVDVAERRGTRLESLKIFACGGAAVPPELIRRANRVFAKGKAFRVFGSSECPMITQGSFDDDLAANSDGRVFDWDVKIVDQDGQRVGPGVEGEILARGPSLFRGYTSEEANREAFDANGYFRTGDLGILTEDGVVTITGRKKDIIIRGGENISAKEIEDALHEHPALREAAIVAMPHPRLGEGVCAFVVAKGNEFPNRAVLDAYLGGCGLARQKWPERLEYVEELPKTASGKVQKHVLRKTIADRIASEGGASDQEGRSSPTTQ